MSSGEGQKFFLLDSSFEPSLPGLQGCERGRSFSGSPFQGAGGHHARGAVFCELIALILAQILLNVVLHGAATPRLDRVFQKARKSSFLLFLLELSALFFSTPLTDTRALRPHSRVCVAN